MSDQKDVVVIGGGIVGCSVLYALAKMGCTNTVLIEKGELTSGSTWHAAGNITHFGHYAEITKLYADSLDMYLQAEQEAGTSIGFHQTGSLRLANNREELEAYLKLEKFYEELKIPYRVVDVDEVSRLHPLVKKDGILGAAFTPDDGHVDPSLTTHALASCSRNLGAEIIRNTRVRSIKPIKDGGWDVIMDDDVIKTQNIVLATSFWTRELTLPLNLDLPLYAFEHHEIITEDIPELKQLDYEIPAVRDSRAPSNVRQEKHSLLCGVYEDAPKLWSPDGVPHDFGQELLVPDLERLEDNLLRVIERMPAFGEYGIKLLNNGPLCFPPDGCPLVGPLSSFPGLWIAAGFPVGIGTGGGSGQYLAHWMINGSPPYKLSIIHPDRFSEPQSRNMVFEKMAQTYRNGYTLPTQ